MSKQITEETVLEMAKEGVLFTHKKSKTHPKMKPYMSGSKNELELLNPDFVVEKLAIAGEFLQTVKARNGTVLFVGTTAPSRAIVVAYAKHLNMPVVTNRWIGGTLTNFSVIRSRVQYMQKLIADRERGAFEKYTKKERLEFDKKIAKMQQIFSGIASLDKLPDVVFLIDPSVNETVINETKKTNIPIIAILDSNDNIEKVDYPVIGNDHSRSSIVWLMRELFGPLPEIAAEEKI